MRSAVIVSTARTPIGRAYRGAFNALPAPTLGAHSIRAAVERAGIEPGAVDDVVFGAALQQGHAATNVARLALLRAGLPDGVSGMSLDRQCASGLMAVATAAKQIVCDQMDITIGGGLESISLIQTPEMRATADPELQSDHPDAADSRSCRRALWHQSRSLRRICTSVPASHRCRTGGRQV
jgi:acetyl-CoA C-acetyltransferase